MENSNRDDGINCRVMDNIRFSSRRLARGQTVPGMAVEDYQQDLVLDLLHRQKSFDPRLRIVCHVCGSRHQPPDQHVGEPDLAPQGGA